MLIFYFSNLNYSTLMKSTFFFCITFLVLFSSCNTNQKPVVPPNRIELMENGSGFVSRNQTLYPGQSFNVKLWIYAHYSFSKIQVSHQELSPNLGTLDEETPIVEDVPNGIVFSSNYTTTIAGLSVTSDPSATEKWIFTVTDNQGKMFSEEIILTTDNSTP